ncbi:MAG TPA: hypothetical protein VIH68_02725 [Bacteroidota bacterium]
MRGLHMVMVILLLSATASAQRQEGPESTSPHFTLRYETGYTDEEVEWVKTELESAYRQLSEKYGFELQSKVPVYLTGSEVSYSRKVISRERWGAVYSGGTLYFEPMTFIRKNGGLTITVRHALCHVVLQPMVVKGCPPWLVEALAVDFSGELEILMKPSQTSVKFFTDLNEALQEARTSTELEMTYYLLGLSMRYFEERFGARKISEMFKSFDGRSLDNQVMERVFGVTYNDLQYQWSQYVDRRINAS